MEMNAAAISLVMVSGMFHASWNMLAKSSRDKNAFLWHCQWIGILLFAPWALIDLHNASFTTESILLLIGSAVIHGGYVLLLAKAYTVGDLSHAYPVMRGTSPLLVPIIGVTLLGETVTAAGWAGIALILIGIFAINGGFKKGFKGRTAVTLYAFAVGLSITAYTVVDRLALDYFSPALLNNIGNIGNLIALSIAASRGTALLSEWRHNKMNIAAAGLLAPSGYLLFLYALHYAPLAVLAPMREIGTVFAALLAVFILKEKQGTRRVFASILITAGILCLGLLT
ncbi:DMT family transporter [Paenibacillus sp. sptzw28]|uniref:DMT family transporter n=1 Tax=Paenibacillus sp. sptzw28 TaxID=715179 RepID=UPI001C6E549F|nr:DMT family transporter [Paenibacillus sp. sptzw28]QYR22899.1 DMT family transporter [Paenibacillus sp. sptzw28]